MSMHHMPYSPVSDSKETGTQAHLLAHHRLIIAEELWLLRRVLCHLRTQQPEGNILKNQSEDLIEWRDTIAGSHDDELPQIIAYMTQLSQLQLLRESRTNTKAVNPRTPYFGHLRLKQGDRVRDVLIGNGSITSSQVEFSLVDWRNSPMSQIFYLYQEGEEYEEWVEEREISGKVLSRRIVEINKGKLCRIKTSEGTFEKMQQGWQFTSSERGSEVVSSMGGRPAQFGTGIGSEPNRTHHLQAITALIDANQFQAITLPQAGVVVLDGGAGSGKTTVALHRLAYLSSQDSQRFQPQRMGIVLQSKALAKYIHHVLPSLEVEGIRIRIFQEFVEGLRMRHFPMLPAQISYRTNTPALVSRFKQDAHTWRYLEQFVEQWRAELQQDIFDENSRLDSAKTLTKAWQSLSGETLGRQLKQYIEWLKGTRTLAGVEESKQIALSDRKKVTDDLTTLYPDWAQPASLALTMWKEAFIRLDRLQKYFQQHAPNRYSRDELDTISQHALLGYDIFQDWINTTRKERRSKKPKSAAATENSEQLQLNLFEEAQEAAFASTPSLPELDIEDDVLLLLLFQEVVAPLQNRNQRALQHTHLMVDEAQDFSVLDLKLLYSTLTEPTSLTLAGDANQYTLGTQSAMPWQEVLDWLNVNQSHLTSLEIGYRSSATIMEVASAVLEDDGRNRKWQAVRAGSPVMAWKTNSVGLAVMGLKPILSRLIKVEPGASVALIARHPQQAKLYWSGFQQAGLSQVRLVDDQNFSFAAGIDITDVLQVRGLEFDYVILLDVDAYCYPATPSARHLLHIGATRAVHQLGMVYCSNPSPLLPASLVAKEF